ncbi:propanediol utilization protein [Desulfosporosinus orientis DSM 765]|uniref:Phosphate propanoyltransferase n=1 Tax=Desulfosporosinus orientis (strain ATCC 19365 / DSM 765 / NCIMB 8382 / VKM B-1628 / Singapore I) TaxID=768706 RepID=G7WEV1_DESOD|nr:phosphate propanoyltransferase [Desulfosporosinus orientis]AET67280.1 propanediol utilization protein [Desulfosporosinus orientis DSM 765]
MIVTEYELRANWHKTKDKLIIMPPGSVITPSARDFITSKGIEVQIEGNGLKDIRKTTLSNASQSMVNNKQPEPVSAPAEISKEKAATSNGSSSPSSAKPEHMTHLRAGSLVTKTHPIIAYRGQLDLFQCELVEAQGFFQLAGERELIGKLDEIAALCRQLMVSEVKQEPFQWTTLIGLTPEELRERSHHPQKYFGIDHTPLSYTHGPVVAKLHHLRAKSREVELYANRAFTDETGACSRTDLIQALNRLSSAFYILACEVRGRKNKDLKEKWVPVGTSNRHIHLSQGDLTALFGENYQLTVQKELSQPGQFAAKETVTLVGPKGSLEKVRVLGPVRKNTQVEISVTDCFKLGVKPVIRDSGEHEGTPGLEIVGPAGKVQLESGVMVASRHIHLHTDDAQEWSLKDGDRVCVRVESGRPIVYEDVLIRVSDQYQKEMHLDLDEANAALVVPTSRGKLMEV